MAAACGAAAPAAHAAGAPTMALDQVRDGMRCTGYTVVKGTTPTPFDVDVLGVVAGDAAARQPFILVRTSGPEVQASGIASGFSGSPMWCPDATGTPRIAGAISATIGQYGNDVGLATPIASVLGEPVEAPVRTRVRAALVRSARPVDSPLSFSGLSSPVARAVQAVGAKAGREVYAAPAPPADFARVPMVPGSSMAVGLAAGDISSGAIGTVSYVDGDRLWAFGHPLDSAGARSLFLQDSYVYDVVDNPVGSAELSSYKYATPGHVIGTLTNDAISAVVGRLGAGPPAFPMTVTAHDLDRGTKQVARVQVADETGVGLPTGTSALSQVAPVAVAQLAYTTLGGVPARQSGRLCLRIAVRQSAKPLRYCKEYVGGAGSVDGLVNGPLVGDVAAATAALDGYRYGPLQVKGVAIDLSLRRETRQSYLRSVRAPRVLRRGERTRVRVVVHRETGGDLTRGVDVRVASDAARGEQELVLRGTDPDVVAGGSGGELGLVLDLGGEDGGGTDEARTVPELATQVADIAVQPKLTARVGRADAQAIDLGPGRVGGSARTQVVVR